MIEKALYNLTMVRNLRLLVNALEICFIQFTAAALRENLYINLRILCYFSCSNIMIFKVSNSSFQEEKHTNSLSLITINYYSLQVYFGSTGRVHCNFLMLST